MVHLPLHRQGLLALAVLFSLASLGCIFPMGSRPPTMSTESWPEVDNDWCNGGDTPAFLTQRVGTESVLHFAEGLVLGETYKLCMGEYDQVWVGQLAGVGTFGSGQTEAYKRGFTTLNDLTFSEHFAYLPVGDGSVGLSFALGMTPQQKAATKAGYAAWVQSVSVLDAP